MAELDLGGRLSVEVGDDSLSDFCRELAMEAYRARGLDPYDDEDAFDEFRYDVVEPEVLGALERGIASALAQLPGPADGAWSEGIG